MHLGARFVFVTESSGRPLVRAQQTAPSRGLPLGAGDVVWCGQAFFSRHLNASPRKHPSKGTVNRTHFVRSTLMAPLRAWPSRVMPDMFARRSSVASSQPSDAARL